MKSTRPTENIEGVPLTYTQSSLDHLDENEKELYWNALQEVEDNFAKIAKIQNERTNSDGEIQRPISDEELKHLKVRFDAFAGELAWIQWRDPNHRKRRILIREHVKALADAGVPPSEWEIPEDLHGSDEQTDAGTDVSGRK